MKLNNDSFYGAKDGGCSSSGELTQALTDNNGGSIVLLDPVLKLAVRKLSVCYLDKITHTLQTTQPVTMMMITTMIG